ncbi:MAG TPA: hypothetical protein VHD31_00035 [Candidatus Paceibacterota bacterium]|nr:hypothetical protein [Candidatus Paceibacterota bacterium]
MQNSTRTWVVLAAVVIVVLGGIALFMGKSTEPVLEQGTATTTPTAATSTATTTSSANQNQGVNLNGALTQSQVDAQYKILQQGQDKKNAGDYRGAAAIWEGLAESHSFISYIAYNNLADMYENVFHNYPSAEINYQKVVELKPDYIDGYRNLYMLYTVYGYKSGTSAAADILAQGLKANPNNPDLLKLQAQLNAQAH